MNYIITVKKGMERNWYKCKCGVLGYIDYRPYSLSSPILAMPCGHMMSDAKPTTDPMKTKELL
jgi:hypothetical protein